MSLSKPFLKNYLSAVYNVITQPRRFYQDMPVSGGFIEPLVFAVLTIFIISLLNTAVLVASWVPLFSPSYSLFFTIAAIAALFLCMIFIMLVSLPINVIKYHIFLKIFSAKGNVEATLRAFCYYTAMSYAVVSIAFVFLLSSYVVKAIGLQYISIEILTIISIMSAMVLVLYSFYVLLVGFSKVHNISMKRTILAIFGIPIALFLLLMALMAGLVFIAEQSSAYNPPPSYYDTPLPYDSDYNTYYTYNQSQQDNINPQSNLTAPYNTAPVLDGYYTPEDGWDETQPINFTSGGTECTIAAKHDDLMLYILVMWKGEPEWVDSIAIFFEQDGNSHDHKRSTGLIDDKYNGATKYGPANFVDAHNDEGVRESNDGAVYANYDNGSWVQEWVIPLKSGDHGDIYVDEYPTTLGFAIDSREFSGPHWPSLNAQRLRPQYWGDLKILE